MDRFDLLRRTIPSPTGAARCGAVLRQITISGMIVVFILMTACTGFRSSAPPTSDQPTRLEVRVGDTVRVLTKYRERHSFKVTGLTATSLVGSAVKLSAEDSEKPGEPVEVPFTDLAMIEVKHVSALRTAGTGTLVLLVAGLAVLAVVGVPVPVPAP